MDTLAAAALLALALPALSGCLSGGPDPSDDGPAPGPTTGGPGGSLAVPVAHTAAGEVPLPAGWDGLRMRTVATGYVGGEPTVGVAADGTLFVNAATGPALPVVGPMALPALLRSRDGGASWEEVGDPALRPKANGDPWLWVDPATDRVFDANLYGGCTWLEWSDDGGENWEGNPAAGCGKPGQDFAKLTGGPPAPGTQTDGYPSVLYYSYQALPEEATFVSTSLDGGRTFSLPVEAHPQGCHGGLASPVAVAPDGTAYSARFTCEAVEVAVSRDSGATWGSRASLADAGDGFASSLAPALAVDAAGNAYLAFPGADGLMRLSASRDGGLTWSPPVRASPPGVRMTAFVAVVAAEPGQVAIASLATTDDPATWSSPAPGSARPEADWHLLVTFARDALAADPLFVTAQATPAGDPVQRGCIGLWASTCGGNLWDFIGMAQRDGRTAVSFTDGCDGCPDAASSDDWVVSLALADGALP